MDGVFMDHTQRQRKDYETTNAKVAPRIVSVQARHKCRKRTTRKQMLQRLSRWCLHGQYKDGDKTRDSKCYSGYPDSVYTGQTQWQREWMMTCMGNTKIERRPLENKCYSGSLDGVCMGHAQMQRKYYEIANAVVALRIVTTRVKHNGREQTM